MGFDYRTVTIVHVLATWLNDSHRLILNFRCILTATRGHRDTKKILARAIRADLRLKIITSDLL